MLDGGELIAVFSTDTVLPVTKEAAKQAESDFEFSRASMKRLLVDVPLLSTEAESAMQISIDAARVD